MTKLNSLNGWTGAKAFNSRMSAQSFFNKGKMALASSCSSGCGTGDDGKEAPKPSSCGSACGAGDK
jgi:hypothetical protein